MAESWSERDLAYLAGILDGEGSFALSTGRQQGNRHATQVIVGNTDAKLIHWLTQKFGGSVNVRVRKNKRHKDCWIWLLSGPSIEPVLAAVAPYLVLKREQAELLIAYRKTVNPIGTNHRVSDETSEHRSQMKSRLLVLNKRGVA